MKRRVFMAALSGHTDRGNCRPPGSVAATEGPSRNRRRPSGPAQPNNCRGPLPDLRYPDGHVDNFSLARAPSSGSPLASAGLRNRHPRLALPDFQ